MDEAMVKAIPRIDPEEVFARLRQGEDMLIVDVRKPESYRARHIAGARHIPRRELLQRLSELPREKTIIFY